MSALDPVRATLSDLRKSRAAVREKMERLAEKRLETPDDDSADLTREIERLRAELDGLRAREIGGAARDLDPRQWISALDGRTPVLLFPLRIQTRYSRSPDGRSLLVRVYPDDISVQSHDPALTAGERSAAAAFWTAPKTTTDPKVRTTVEIWRGLVQRFGPSRAAWIMRATDPAIASRGTPAAARLVVPAVWTLPERLIFRCYGPGDRVVAEVPGEPIPDGLEMGVDSTRPDAGFSRTSGEIEYPPELAWQVEFEAAIKVGMGVRIPINLLGTPDGRLERLVVLGVRLSTDERRSADLLEGLIHDHRFADGFSLVPQGTPTNVTSDADAPAAPDPDAMLKWLQEGGAYSDDGQKTKLEDESDGLRLAHALGIAPEALRYVEHANASDGAEAIAIKRALWAGTLGYYAQQMLWPLYQDGDGERLAGAARFFFTHFVFGRGPLPAIRVGNQPYGILTVSADALQPFGDAMSEWEDRFLDQFIDLLHGKLAILARTWVDAIPQLPRAVGGNIADTRLVDLLSLQASSVEYHAERLIGKTYLMDYVDFSKRGAVKFDVYDGLLTTRYNQFTARFPGLFGDKPRIFDLTFFGPVWKQIVEDVKNLDRGGAPLLDGDVVDDLPYSETRRIADTYPNYIRAMEGMDFAEIRRGLTRTKDDKVVPVTALLYVLLRHSYMYEHAFGAMRLYRHFQGQPWGAFQEKELYNLLYALDTTYWDTLEAEPAPTWPGLGLGDARITALKLLQTRGDFRGQVPLWNAFFGDIDELYRALRRLQGLPTARLERLFAEHIDLCSYRIDAWLTGLAYQRLLAQRAWRDDLRGNRLHPLRASADEPSFRRDGGIFRYDLNHRPLESYARGVYLGAFGWVESLEPDAPAQVVADLPEDLKPKDGRPVTRDADNHGLIQAPSLNQAATAALLRAASVTEPGTTAFNIDLSSARVREALWIVDGVRNGQTPAALLGYKFERGLREHDVVLLRHLPSLRQAFPMPRPVETDAGAVESIAARDVVNGLRLIQARRDGTLDGILVPFMPDGGERGVVATLAAGLLNALDACSDLMLAESVHQASLGNYDRAGGVVTAAGEFTHVPDSFEVIETPRSGTSLTHRLVIALNQQSVPPAGATPRARLAPELNDWIRALLGDLSGIACGIAYEFHTAAGRQRASYAVTLDRLNLPPIDLLFVLDDTRTAEFAGRLALLTRTRFASDHPAATIDQVEVQMFPAGPAGSRPLGQFTPFVTMLRQLLTSSRAAARRDLVPPNVLHGQSPQDVDGIDLDELVARVDALRVDFEAKAVPLGSVGGLGVSAVEAALLNAASFGLGEAIPLPGADLDALRKQAERVETIMASRLEAMKAKWDNQPTAPKGDGPAVLREAAGLLLGGAFPLMPRIQPVADFASAARPAGAPTAERIDEWLFLASSVRPNAARLLHTRVIAGETSKALPELQIFEWPAGQPAWLAQPNSFDPKVVRDYLSIVVQTDGNFLPSNSIVALVVDEWNELVPNETETTGVSFHYDAPNAEPPQTLLLAVSARRREFHGNWTWDELAGCVDQALLLAKMRAVGPDELRRTELDAVLPATVAAETVTPVTIAANFLVNISDSIANSSSNLWSKM